MKEHGICVKCKKSVGCPYAYDRIKGCKKFVLEDELKLTNEEYIRSCTFEELAGAIYEWYSAGYTTGRIGLPLNPITGIVEWLKEKHHA